MAKETSKKKAEKTPGKKPAKKAETKTKKLPGFPSGGRGSKLGKRLDQHWKAIEARFSDKPKPSYLNAQKWDPELVATNLWEYVDTLPFPHVPLIEEFCFLYGIPRRTLYSIIEKSDPDSFVSLTHSRVFEQQKRLLIRCGELELIHPGIQKNHMTCLGVMDTDAAAMGKAVGESLAYFDELKAWDEEDRKALQKERQKKTKPGDKK